MAPCSYSSGSRTSRNVTPPCSSSVSRVGLLHLADGRLRLVQKISWRGHAATSVAPATSHGRHRTVKHYQRGQHSRSWPRRPRGRLPAMELHEAIRRRAMVRSFSPEPVDPAGVDRLVARRAALPDRRQHRWHGLGGPRGPRRRRRSTGTPPPTRPGARAHPEWCGGPAAGAGGAAGLLVAPTYVARYAEPDKADLGLSDASPEAWPVPYWYRRRRLRRHGRPPGRGRRRPRGVLPRHLPGRAALAADLGVPAAGACSAPWRSAGPTAPTTAPPRSTGPCPPRADAACTAAAGERARASAPLRRRSPLRQLVLRALPPSAPWPRAGPRAG